MEPLYAPSLTHLNPDNGKGAMTLCFPGLYILYLKRSGTVLSILSLLVKSGVNLRSDTVKLMVLEFSSYERN